MKKLFVSLLILTVCIHSLYSYVSDSLGEKFEERNYSRIVSLAPSITEMLVFLELTNRIVGVTRYCNFNTTRVGGIYDPDLEKIIKLKPDIVFMLKMGSIDLYEFLVKNSIPVFVMDFRNVDDIFKNIEKIVKLTKIDKMNKVSSFEKEFYSIVSDVKSIVSGKRFFVMYSYPTIYTSASNSYVSDLIRRIGGINLTDSFPSEYQTLIVGLETLLTLKPDFVVITSENFSSITNELKSLLKNTTFIYVDPMDLSPSLRITNFLLKVKNSLKN